MRPALAPRASRTSPSEPASEPLSEALPPSLPGFDLAGASRRLGGNAALLAELLCTFAAEHAGCADRIAGLLREQRPATAAAELHRFKSAARIVGAQALAAAADALEHDVRHGRETDVAAFGGALADAVRAIGAHASAGRPPQAS